VLFEQADGQRGTIATSTVHNYPGITWQVVHLVLQALQGNVPAPGNIPGVPFLRSPYVEEQWWIC
jgi:hypothetical protein